MTSSLVSFATPDSLKRAIQGSELRFDFDERVFDYLVSVGLPPLTSPSVFALILGISPKLLTAMAKVPLPRYYREFPLPKKSGGERKILAPRTFLKVVQYYIAHEILAARPVSEHATGFVRGRGIVQNARVHVGRPFLLNVDLENFFGTVHKERVAAVFRELGYPRSMSDTLTELCTVAGALPQGAPTSPALSNLIFIEVDRLINELALQHGCIYSRYADDLTFSSHHRITREFLNELRLQLARFGFRLNEKKTRFSGPGQAHFVTGLVVNVRVHLNRRERRRLRAMFHNASITPGTYRERQSELLGWASYVNSFDFELGQKYLNAARLLHRT